MGSLKFICVFMVINISPDLCLGAYDEPSANRPFYSEDALLVLSSIARIMNTIQDLVIRNDPRLQTNQPPVKPTNYPQVQTETISFPFIFPGMPGSADDSTTTTTPRPLPPLDFSALWQGFNQAYRSGSKCLVTIRTMPTPPTSELGSGGGTFDRFMKGVIDFIQGLKNDENITKFINDVPFLNSAIQMVARMILTSLKQINPDLVKETNDVTKESIELLLEAAVNMVKMAPNFGACMFQENIRNPALPTIMTLFKRFGFMFQ